MKTLLIILFASLCLGSNAQALVDLDNLSQHVGDSVTVKGNFLSVRYLSSARNKPTIISLGEERSNGQEKLRVVIFSEVRKKLGYKPEEKPYSTGGARISGKVELVKGKPQIVIKDPKQLVISYDEEVPLSEIPPIEKNN